MAKQLVEQQGRQFLANTRPYPKEQCKAITIRCGKQVAFDVNKKVVENNQTTITNGEDRVEEGIQPEVVTVEDNTEVRTQDEKKSDKNQNLRKIQEGVHLKHVSYPHAPSR